MSLVGLPNPFTAGMVVGGKYRRNERRVGRTGEKVPMSLEKLKKNYFKFMRKHEGINLSKLFRESNNKIRDEVNSGLERMWEEEEANPREESVLKHLVKGYVKPERKKRTKKEQIAKEEAKEIGEALGEQAVEALANAVAPAEGTGFGGRYVRSRKGVELPLEKLEKGFKKGIKKYLLAEAMEFENRTPDKEEINRRLEEAWQHEQSLPREIKSLAKYWDMHYEERPRKNRAKKGVKKAKRAKYVKDERFNKEVYSRFKQEARRIAKEEGKTMTNKRLSELWQEYKLSGK